MTYQWSLGLAWFQWTFIGQSSPNHDTNCLVTRVKATGQQQPDSLCGCGLAWLCEWRQCCRSSGGDLDHLCESKAGGWPEKGKTPVEHVLPWEECASVQGGNTGREHGATQVELVSPPLKGRSDYLTVMKEA